MSSPSLHPFITFIYIAALPAAVVIDAVRAHRMKRAAPGPWIVSVVLAGVLIGAAMCVIYSFATGGKLRIGQAALASYFAIALLIVLRVLDQLVQRSLRLLLRVNRPVEKPSLLFRARLLLAGLTRLVFLFAIGLPYVMASVLTYRPKVGLTDDPQKQLGYEYVNVSFAATDRTMLSGWWMPAEHPRGKSTTQFGQNTVLICHGLASNKSNQLVLARGFVPYGYNALIFDFRAHGASGGQLTSFGDLERRDVLGAIRWIRANHADESKKIFGLGASMGAAALIAAAAEPSPEGRAIDAIAVYGTYDSLKEEMRYVANERFYAPLAWVIRRFALPMASVQVGADLRNFSPALLVRNLWPRPILVVHGLDDDIIAFERGQSLFDSAQQPKSRIWVDHAGHNDLINDDPVMDRVRAFFESAVKVPVI